MKTGDSSAPTLRHAIGRQRLDVRVASEAQAHALLERVGTLNRDRLLPAIERVLDEFDRPGEVILIDRLDLDLGRVAESRLGELESLLAEALRAALRRTVGTAPPTFTSPEERAHVASARLVMAEAFGHYLDAGAWPYRSVLDPATRPAHLFARLLDEAPEALVPMLRVRRGSGRGLRRLVRQMPDPLLERLLGLLDPDSAHWILLYMADTRIAHRAEPVVDQPLEEFARTLWFVVLRDALQRSGLRSNRRTFVAKLIADLALSIGADPVDLLRALRRGLEAAPSAARGDASLLSILAEIGRDDAGAERVEAGSDSAARGRSGLADPAAAFAELEQVLATSESSRETGTASAAQAALRLGLTAEGTDDRGSAFALLAALAAEDKAKLRRLLRDSASSGGQAAAGLLAACDLEEAADLILPPHLAAAVGGLIRIAGCDASEREALFAAAAAIPPSAPAAFALADLAPLLASLRRTSVAELLAALRAEALAAGGGDGRTLAALLGEVGAPASRAHMADVRRELALDTLRALLDGRLVGPPGEEGEAALAALAGTGADWIRGEIALEGLRPRAAAAALSRLPPRALLRLVALLAPVGGGREDVRAALAEAGVDRARLTVLAAWLIVGGTAPPPPRRLAAPRREAPTRAPTRTGRDRNERELFLLVRRDPAALIGRGSETGLDSTALALLFSRLPEADRREAEAMGRMLSGPAARRAFGAGLVVSSLLAAVRQALARRGWGSFAGLWRAALVAAASTAERETLDRLLPAPAGRREPLRPPGGPPEPGSAEWLLALLDAPPDEARHGLRLLRSAALRRRLSRRLPRHLLCRLLFAVRPHEARALLGSAELIRGALAAEGRGIAPEALWDSLLDSALAPPGAALARLVERIVPAGSSGPPGLAAALLARARAARHGPLAAALEGHAAAAAGRRRRRPPAVPEAEPADRSDRTGLVRDGEVSILVANAGLVIAAPFLGPLCERAGLAAAAGGGFRWAGPEAAGRAVHLLQYLADGRTDAPEPMLALNKILCGLDPSWPLLPEIEMTPLERETCDSLLASILALWPPLSESSVAALRETFLQREGRLSRTDQGWKLEVERKTVDILLEMLPWSFSTILTPWAPHPLSVAW